MDIMDEFSGEDGDVVIDTELILERDMRWRKMTITSTGTLITMGYRASWLESVREDGWRIQASPRPEPLSLTL